MKTSLLIIGAGPFGLAMAAHAQHLGIDYVIAGKAMEFWKNNMPEGMYLRSKCDWHLDPENNATIENFLASQNLAPAEVEPLSLDFYLSYTGWFQHQKKIEVLPVYITRLDFIGDHHFHAHTNEGADIYAENVVVAVGFKYFQHIPPDLHQILPHGSYTHTCDYADMTAMTGKRYLIIGGRQSAFEWAALLSEAGAASIGISYRHNSPSFATSDWSWVNTMVENLAENPAWFRKLSQEEKDSVGYRLWTEGRLKIEPWLERRVMKENIKLWPLTLVAACKQLSTGELVVTLNNGSEVIVDHIILATGYKVDISHVPFIADGNMISRLSVHNGFPVLDEHFQANLPGLFITSMPASHGFGPFFGFTISVRTSARLIGKDLMKNLKSA
jgi:cation diffusion facilitator CzcD-associated flavoprotein CzcO